MSTEVKKPFNTNPFPQMEEEVTKFWEENEIFEKSVAGHTPSRSTEPPLLIEGNHPDYVFYDGPPFATGTPHYGHIVGSVMKDVVPRYWTMRGFRVERKWGWDCHGLPIENIVEKELGSKRKKDIEEMGVAKFNELCRSKVLSYVEEWEKVISRLGRWADMKNAYKTMDLPYMESIWKVFKDLYDKGLVYESHRSMHVCPRCETTLSQSEVAEGYMDVKDLSATAKFKLKAGQKIGDFVVDDNTYILAWTTTPWTLIGNVALAVGEDIDYVKISVVDEYYILAKDRVKDTLGEREYEIIGELKGSELVGLSYEPVFDYYLDRNEELLKSVKQDDGGQEVVVMAIANKKGEFLLGYRNYMKDKPYVGHDFWIAPGGKVEVGETLEQGMRRELQEECNITDFKIKKYLGGYPGYLKGHNLHCFLLEVEDFEQVKNNEPEKFAEWKFFSADNLPVSEFPNKEADQKFFLEAIQWHNAYKIYAADFVTINDGVGVVHIAPAFGDDDMRVGKENDLPFVQHVSIDGRIKSGNGEFSGADLIPRAKNNPAEVREIDLSVVKHLKDQGRIFHSEKYTHSYPHCWRCDTALLNYATSSWFVAITKFKDRALETAESINWSPKHIKEGRFGQWLAGARDWSISRQRFWASVMPIWKCKSDECNHLKVLGSVAELEELSGQKVTDLHKHIVDEITIPCEKCGGVMQRVPDVLDTWFDSGSMPYAQMHYPFENKEKFENNFPAEFIAEGIDQTRCWFYYLHAIATALHGKPAFKNVIVNGIVLAEDGKKMAKKLKNYPDPMELMRKHGSDALRFYLLSSPVMAAENLNFSEKGVMEVLRNNVMTLWNVYKFYELFSESSVATENMSESENVLDRWIMARLNQLIGETTESMNAYDLPRAVRPITLFINDLSTWYLRRSRDRFKSDDVADREAALATTKFVLLELVKVMAPFTPFIAEQIWQKVSGNNFANTERSVHLESWSVSGQIDEKLIMEMDQVRKIVELGLAKRDEAKIKIRQPLSLLRVTGYVLREEYIDLVKDELNVKDVKCVEAEGEIKVELDTVITPELKLEGIKRELVRFINNMRKDMELSLNDRAEVYYETDSTLVREAIEKFAADIMNDTLSESVKFGLDSVETKREVKIEGEVVILGIIRK